jgi:glyoxylase-like metal-dependent hydrolase (beta-lactamase superfamily II)
MDYRVISMGTLSCHPLWNERDEVRTGHGTTTLIRAGKLSLIVDPSLPAEILRARMRERTDLPFNQVTHVFLTSFNPELRRGLGLFDHATWWISAAEREAAGPMVFSGLHKAEEAGDDDMCTRLSAEVEVLRRLEPAPDSITKGVDLFPLHGVTQGLTGLILSAPNHTAMVCGDAIPTLEHLYQRLAPRWAMDATKAKESIVEALGIADVFVLGREGVVLNPTRRVL